MDPPDVSSLLRALSSPSTGPPSPSSPPSQALSALHRLVVTREIEDDESLDVQQVCECLWLILLHCWGTKESSEQERLAWETATCLLALPGCSSEHSVRRICDTFTVEFCHKLLSSFERGITEFDSHGAHLLRWIYLRTLSLRRPLRVALGARLVKYGQSPDVLKVVNITPLLRLLGDIVAGANGLTSNRGQRLLVQHHLLVNVLLPLHRPNQMVEWRDQIPVLQLYHESLVRCLVRLAQWDAKTRDDVDVFNSPVGGIHASGGLENGSSGIGVTGCRDTLSCVRPSVLETWEENEDREVKGEHNRSLEVNGQQRGISRGPPPSVRPGSLQLPESSSKLGAESLLVVTVRSLLESLWPEGFNTNTPKEILLLHEVEKLLEMSSPVEFSTLLDVVLNRLKISLMHDNVRTIQRALHFFRNEPFLDHIRPHASVVIHRLVPALYRKGRLFWNLTVNKMTAAVLKKLLDLDPESFAACSEEIAGTEPPSKRNISATNAREASRSLSRSRPQPEQSIREEGTSGGGSSRNRLPPLGNGLQPPSFGSSSEGVVAPMGSMRQQILAASSSPGSTPPVTITGVAPWAVQQQSPHAHQPQHRRVKIPTGNGRLGTRHLLPPSSSSSLTDPELSSSTDQQSTQQSGLKLVRRYMKHCRISGNGGDPTDEEHDNDDFDDNDNEDAPSTWSRDQAGLQPKLLPALRFHDLVFGQVLGEGSFGTVKYGRQIIKGPRSLRSKWPEYAVKILSQPRLQALGRNGLQLACREIAALHCLSHPGIARLVSAFRYTDGYYLVLEYASQGDLHSYIIQQGRLNETFTRFVVGEISAALISIHDLGLAYNDLKPENILITEVGHIKLADFGACRAVTADGRALLAQGNTLLNNLRDGDWKDSIVENSPKDLSSPPSESRSLHEQKQDAIEAEGTPGYLPPEILSHASVPGWKSDSWALGCVLFFCLVGRPKYFGSTFEEVLQQIKAEFDDMNENSHNQVSVHFDSVTDDSDEILSGLSMSTSQLLGDLLAYDPSTRISIPDVCRHPFFNTTGDNSEVDPLNFHLQDPLKLPRSNAGQIGASSAEDKAWARRQCSMVWSPMPKAYDFGTGSNTEGSGGNSPGLASGSVRRIFTALERETIEETDGERLCSWLP